MISQGSARKQQPAAWLPHSGLHFVEAPDADSFEALPLSLCVTKYTFRLLCLVHHNRITLGVTTAPLNYSGKTIIVQYVENNDNVYTQKPVRYSQSPTPQQPSFFLKNLFFNCRKIALQCCVGFWHTTTQISHNYIHVLSLPLPTPTHPTPLVTEHQAGLYVLYIVIPHQLSILHMIVYMCQCYFLNLSHPLLPQLYPQYCSLYLLLSFFLVYKFFIKWRRWID